MKSWLLRLRNQNLLFIGTVILTIVAGQAIIQYDLNQQNEDARIINLSGRQRMMSQRIAKIIMYAHEESDSTGTVPKHRIDTLRDLSAQWKAAHLRLLKSKNNAEIDSLLNANTPHLEAIANASQQIIQQPVHAEVTRAIDTIVKHDRPFLFTMERTVAAYQKAAETKLAFLKVVEIALSVLAIAVLVLEFIYIFLPVIRRLEKEVDSLKQTEKNLEESERMYRLLSENSQDVVVLLDTDRRFVFVSQSIKEVLGYEREDFVGKILFDFMHPDDVTRIRTQGDDLRSGKVIGNMVFRIITKAGEYRWGEVKTKPIYSDDGKVELVQAAFRDIHERKMAEEALKKSERQFRTLTDKAPVGIFEINAEGVVTYINKRWFDITGLDPSCCQDDRITAIHPDDREKVMALWKKALSAGEEFSYEFRYHTPKKGTTWVTNNTARLTNDQGEVIGYIGTVIDTTASREAERKIAESERLYRLISTNSKDLISIFTADERPTTLFVSPSSKDILGYEPEELIGTSPFDLMLPEEAEELKKGAHQTTLNGKPAKTVNRLKKKDGSLIWIEAYSSPIIDDKGVMMGFQSSARDITDRKQFELELIKAKERAEEATIAKSQFLSMISHEIRTPMNAIIGLTHLMLEDEPREDQLESLRLLKFSGENLLTIINDILDLNKIEAGKIELENISFHLKELLQYHTTMLEVRANDKGIRLIFTFEDAVPHIVKGDPVRLGQIINNLLSNAIKFTDKGYVELKVSLKSTKRDDNKCEIMVEVKDTGIGIAPDNIDLIFENFTQASSDTTRKFGGTGLGLPITKKLLQLMGSDIAVTSQPGFGSTFSFTIALEQSFDEITLEKSYSNKDVAEQLTYARVLLVEDNRVNQIVAGNFLKKWGIDVTLANHGKEALELIQQKNFDLVLMDLQMPEMDGYEATRHIRQMDDPYFKEVPIIALTASAMFDIKTKAIEIGMTDFITKPFHPGELQSKIGKYIQAKSIPYQSSVLASNLNIFSNGDPGFRNELVQLLLGNLKELKVALQTTQDKNDPDIFYSASHKVKTSISLIANTELTVIIEEIKQQLKAGNTNTAASHEIFQRFYELTERIQNTLQKEWKD